MVGNDYRDDDFEWDCGKAADNVRNHDGVSFEIGCKVFADPFSYEFEDTRQDYGEQRFVVIGAIGQGQLLTVVSTPRGHRTRIISAWISTREERRKYHEANRR
jgi:uncharacterized protein